MAFSPFYRWWLKQWAEGKPTDPYVTVEPLRLDEEPPPEGMVRVRLVNGTKKALVVAALLLGIVASAAASRLLPGGFVLSADRTPFVQITSCGDTVCALDARRRVWAYDFSVEAWALLGTDRMERDPKLRL